MSPQILLMFIFFTLLLLGVPVAILILLTAIIGLFFREVPMTIIVQNLQANLISQTYLAVPMYVFAGILMSESGIARKIFDFANSVVGHVKGGLGHVNVLASMIFAGISGSSTADAAGLGRIEIQAMNEAGYDVGFSAAITAVSSIIGPIIPPSIHMMIYATIAEVPAATLLIAGLGPGLLMGFALMVAIYIMTATGMVKCPTQFERLNLRRIFIKFKEGFWALIAPIIIIGCIMFGIVTPTEAGVIAVFYTLLIGVFVYKTINLKGIFLCLEETACAMGVVSFMIAVAQIFTWYITIENVPTKLFNFVTSTTDNKSIILIMVAIVLLILGTIATASANIVLVTPILLPLLLNLGMDPIHIGVIIVFGLVIGIITPPVGVSLYVVADVAKLPFEKVVRSVMVFLIPLILCLFILMFFPIISLFIPKLVGLM